MTVEEMALVDQEQIARRIRRVQLGAGVVLAVLVLAALFVVWRAHQRDDRVDELACAMRADDAGMSYSWSPDLGCVLH